MFLPAVLPYPQIDPFIFRFKGVGLSWYAFIYGLSFVIGYFIIRWRYRRGQLQFEKKEDVGLFITYAFYGIVLGARLFYVIFYNPKYFLENPLEIPAIWHGGLSFHGGLVGGMISIWLFAKKHRVNYWQILDAGALCIPIGLGLGRIANFINGELYGRPTGVPWAMVFPRGGPLPRHPSQIYEGILEGPILFAVMVLVARKNPKPGSVTAAGIIAYGVFRFFAEFFREPDPQLGAVLGPFSMGQLLCFAMVLAGFGLLYWIRRFPQTSPNQSQSHRQ